MPETLNDARIPCDNVDGNSGHINEEKYAKDMKMQQNKDFQMSCVYVKFQETVI